MAETRAPTLFLQCEDAVRKDVLITRESARDKEFAAQDWVQDRLNDAGLSYEESGRNTYPDFPLTDQPSEGFEVKSLAHPGRCVLRRQQPAAVRSPRRADRLLRVRALPQDGGHHLSGA